MTCAVERAALGLLGIAVKAGARSALGTLWRVNDAATAEFMARFYSSLRARSTSRAQAVRDAQTRLLSDPSYCTPLVVALLADQPLAVAAAVAAGLAAARPRRCRLCRRDTREGTIVSADSDMRKAVGQVPPGLELPAVELVRAPSLSDATVAVVTSAALAHPGQPWEDQSHEYRLFDADAEGLIMAHNSTNLDRSGFALDRNVAYPIDRLREMESEGVIGRLAPRHASFIGSTFELSTFLLDSGPRLAEALRGDGVDVALLTPV